LTQIFCTLGSITLRTTAAQRPGVKVFEGFGLPIVEAFALGSPLVTSNIGAMAEVAGSAALTVDPYSVGAMREAIDSLATDTALQSDLASKGKLRAAAFNWQKAAAATRNVYLELAP
jgi:alpha-1,3-rhamnosyl/mannosyltransferase